MSLGRRGGEMRQMLIVILKVGAAPGDVPGRATRCRRRHAVVGGSCRCYIRARCARIRSAPRMIPGDDGSGRSRGFSPAGRDTTPRASIRFASWHSWSGPGGGRAGGPSPGTCTCPGTRSMTRYESWNRKDSCRRPGCLLRTVAWYGSLAGSVGGAGGRPATRPVCRTTGARRPWR